MIQRYVINEMLKKMSDMELWFEFDKKCVDSKCLTDDYNRNSWISDQNLQFNLQKPRKSYSPDLGKSLLI